MIDLLKCERSEYTTTVYPSDKIFAELGKNTYDYKDLLSELIDNAIAARIPGKTLEVRIDIYADTAGNPIRFAITDNASGIKAENLGLAIAPAGLQRENSLNEHGLGMKQAISALGQLEYLATKVEGEGRARLIRQFRFGDIETLYVPIEDFDQDTGTEICVTNLKPIIVTHAATVTRSIAPYLGARYRRFLRRDSGIMRLIVNIRKAEQPDIIDYSWPIEEVKPVYFHPSTRRNEPVILKYDISIGDWKAQLTFGYAPKDEGEYAELGLDPPTRFHPYAVSLSKQGLDVILHDRVILFHQLKDLDIVTAQHPDYNNIRGEIDLIQGFSTAITKNSIIFDKNFKECIEIVKAILEGERPGPRNKTSNYLRQKTYPEEIPEKLLRDRLKEWLANNPVQRRDSVITEYGIEGIEGHIDILADSEAWEIKTDQANALDVYQLFMYMDVGNIDKGYLVAKDFSNGAHIAADHIKQAHQKEMILAGRDQFPINHPPSPDERNEYY